MTVQCNGPFSNSFPAPTTKNASSRYATRKFKGGNKATANDPSENLHPKVQVNHHASKDDKQEKLRPTRHPDALSIGDICSSRKRKRIEDSTSSSGIERVYQYHKRPDLDTGPCLDPDGSKEHPLPISDDDDDDEDDGSDASESPPSPTLSSTSTVPYSEKELKSLQVTYPTIKWDARENCIDGKDDVPDRVVSTSSSTRGNTDIGPAVNTTPDELYPATSPASKVSQSSWISPLVRNGS